MPSLKAQVEVESIEEKPVTKPKPILKVVADVEITETPKLKPVADVEITDTPKLKPVADVEITETPKLKPVATVENEEEKTRRPSYVAPKAATKRDVDLLYELDEQKLLELREVYLSVIIKYLGVQCMLNSYKD